MAGRSDERFSSNEMIVIRSTITIPFANAPLVQTCYQSARDRNFKKIHRKRRLPSIYTRDIGRWIIDSAIRAY